MVTKVSDTVVDTMAERQFKYLPHESSGLNFVISGGVLVEIEDDGGPVEFEQQTLVLTDDTTNYIYFEFDNTPATLEVSTSKPTSNIMLIHKVVTSGGEIDTVTDYRWKQVNNRFIQDAFWPAAGTENELIILKHRTSSSDDCQVIIRGLDTPFQRYTVVAEEKAADDRIVAGSSTSGEGYGFWRDMSPDGVRHIQTRSVNTGSGFPFKPYIVDSAGVSNVDWEYIGPIPQMIDDASTPVSGQIHYVEYNPVHHEVIVSANIGWWVYDDNQDGTYSVNRPIDSFDSAPSGSSQRQYRNAAFSADGAYWATAYSGGSTFFFYERSETGARYQQMTADATPGNEYNGALVQWDEANQEFIFKTRTTNIEKISGWVLNGSTWEQAWEEDSTTNADLTNIAGNTQSVWVSSDGQVMLWANTISGGSYGLFKFDRRVEGGWDYDADWTPPEEWTLTWGASDIENIRDGYIYLTGLSGAATDTFDQIWKYENGDFRHVVTLSGGYDEGSFGGSTFPQGATQCGQGIVVLSDGVLTDPADSILRPYAPFWMWSSYCTLGQDNIDNDKQVYGWVTDELEPAISGLANWYIANKDTAVLGPTPVAGPIANTSAFRVVSGNQDIESPNGVFDQNDLLSNNDIIIPEVGLEGAIVIVWRSPASWPAVTDGATTVRPLICLGTIGGWPSTQPGHAFGINVQSLGANAVWAMGLADANGTRQALILNSSENVPTDQWNVTVIQQDLSEGGFQLWNNGVRVDLAEVNTTYSWAGGWYAWLASMTGTKGIQIGSQSTATTNEIADADFHAIAFFSRPFREIEIQRITSEYGL